MLMRPSSRLDLDKGNKSIACDFDVLSQQARKPPFVSCPQLRHQGTMFFDERMKIEVRNFINPDQMSDYGRLLEPQMEQALISTGSAQVLMERQVSPCNRLGIGVRDRLRECLKSIFHALLDAAQVSAQH